MVSSPRGGVCSLVTCHSDVGRDPLESDRAAQAMYCLVDEVDKSGVAAAQSGALYTLDSCLAIAADKHSSVVGLCGDDGQEYAGKLGSGRGTGVGETASHGVTGSWEEGRSSSTARFH